MATEVVSLRLPQGTVRRLRELAHRRSLERGTDVTWAALVRAAIAALLRTTTAVAPPGRPILAPRSEFIPVQEAADCFHDEGEPGAAGVGVRHPRRLRAKGAPPGVDPPSA